MNFEYFFLHEYTIEERQLDIGFELYGAGHIIWLAAIIAAAIIISSRYKKQTGAMQGKIKKFFAIAILLSEVYKDTVIAIIDAPLINYLPFHLCSFAIFGMLADAFGKNDKITGQLFAFAFVPGAAAALLFCNWTCYPFFHFMTIHSFLFHGWIIIYFVMKYRNGEIAISYKGIWQTCATMFVCAVPIYIFNSYAGTNYMFLNEASEGSPLIALWNIFGTRFGEPGYLAAYAVFAVMVLHLMYLIYKVLGKIFKQKGAF